MTEPKGVANYKGVMLCNRPSFDAVIIKERPFVSRVDKKENLGINPVRKIHASQPRKFVNTAILKHKLWLEEFKQKVREEKESTFIDSQHKKTILRRSPSFEQQKAQVEEFFNGNPSQKEKEPEVVEGNNEEQKPEDDPECENLIDFMNNLNYDEFIKDMEVKSIINSLRNKINEKKPQNQLNLIKKSKEDKEEKISDPKPKNPIKQEEWDKSQNNERQSADMETKIAKYLAKEVLKNSQMIRKIHSNASVRKLLEFDKSKVEI